MSRFTHTGITISQATNAGRGNRLFVQIKVSRNSRLDIHVVEKCLSCKDAFYALGFKKKKFSSLKTVFQHKF